MAIVNDIAIAMTVAMAIDNALADATAVGIVPPYQEEEEENGFCFCSRFGHGYCFVHSSGYGYG